ncbi:hypothetical protein NQZ68_032584 [Dissostichus eleginoides]|nr:hypothetical protein NQZ68_032584 [Dissostichus eleginoides]
MEILWQASHSRPCFPLKSHSAVVLLGAMRVFQAMMQESGTEATSNGLANQNGGASVEGGAKSATPSVEVTATDLLHLQQHQHIRQLREGNTMHRATLETGPCNI